MTGKDNFFYTWLSNSQNITRTLRQQSSSFFTARVRKLFASHHLAGNFFHYRTAIEILGWKYSDVFEDGRLDLDPKRWADFGPLNFQLGPPKEVARYLRKMATAKNIAPYSPNILPSLKKAAAKMIFKRNCDQNFEIICTEGTQAALAYCVMTFVDHGEEVIITDPGYFFLEPPVLLAGGVTRRIILSEKNKYRIDIKSLKEKITPRTKMIIVCDPINPFGTIQGKDELEEIIRIANRYNIVVVNNVTHCFHRLDENRKHYPMSSLDSVDLRNVITVAGLSHGCGLAGLRIGFLAGQPRLVSQILSVKSALTRINTNIMTQYAALAALSEKGYFKDCRILLRRNFSVLKKIIQENSRISFVIEPEYGFFACVDTSKIKASCQELTVALLKRKCAVYPSDGLGNSMATSYIRINFSTPYVNHFNWLRKALPDAIREAETRKFRKAVINFFKSVGTARAIRIIEEIDRIDNRA